MFEGEVLDGLAGNDTLTSGFNSATLIGGYGDDTLNVQAFVDIFSDFGENFLYGNGGNDTITVNAELDYSGVGQSLTTLVDGGTGDDTIDVTMEDISNGGNGLDTSLYGGLGNDSITLHSATSTNASSLPVRSDLFGGAGSDLLASYHRALGGDARVDFIVNLDGGTGHDVLIAETDASTEFEGMISVDHIMTGGIGRDELSSVFSSDGSSLAVHIDQSGGTGADVLSSTVQLRVWDSYGSGYSVHNELSGDEGADAISGEFVVEMSDVSGDLGLLNDFSGGDGNDTLDAAILVTVPEDSYIYEGTYSAGTNLLDGGTGHDVLNASIVVENDLVDVTITGHSELYGGAGHDRLTVTGGTGNILDGGTGNDTLVGGDGEDRLIGGEGFDTLTGGLGADTFVFNVIETGYRRDIVTDFTSGTDTIALAIDAFTSLSSYGLGVLDTEALSYGSTAISADDYLFYDADTGTLYYDADGTGVEARTTLAVFTDAPSLLADDIYLI